ncbi:MAG: polysaccharide deacetylase family protein [Microbacterium sp.]|uniref:polysaccharide deacetylase family protein n=1 Tax=Microbacterium sp. TaxID=51671 RepID=UPI003BB08857
MSERAPAMVTRRMLLASVVVSAGGLATACASPALGERQATPLPASPTPEPTIRPPLPRPTPTAPVLVKHPAPTSSFTGLPGEGNLLAWTVDDGTDPAVVAAYAAFAATTGTRLTLFATGSYPAWRENADVLRPLVASGQVQMANHTWTHPDLRSLSDAGIRDELHRTHDLIGELFGVDARPFYRPPFGYYNDRVMHVAADIGYTATTMWYGSIADSSLIPEAEIVRLAHEWFLPQHIVIGHLNHAPVTHVFGDLAQVIADRGLTTVTLNDVFTSTAHP